VIPFFVKLPSDSTFFGLTPKYKLDIEGQIHDLAFHSKGAFSYSDIRSMPIFIRTFHVDRLVKYFDKKRELEEKELRKAKSSRKRR
jgi:hypothetical protein